MTPMISMVVVIELSLLEWCCPFITVTISKYIKEIIRNKNNYYLDYQPLITDQDSSNPSRFLYRDLKLMIADT